MTSRPLSYALACTVASCALAQSPSPITPDTFFWSHESPVTILSEFDSEAAAADFDMSGELDESDIAAFVDAYVEGR